MAQPTRLLGGGGVRSHQHVQRNSQPHCHKRCQPPSVRATRLSAGICVRPQYDLGSAVHRIVNCPERCTSGRVCEQPLGVLPRGRARHGMHPSSKTCEIKPESRRKTGACSKPRKPMSRRKLRQPGHSRLQSTADTYTHTHTHNRQGRSVHPEAYPCLPLPGTLASTGSPDGVAGETGGEARSEEGDSGVLSGGELERLPLPVFCTTKCPWPDVQTAPKWLKVRQSGSDKGQTHPTKRSHDANAIDLFPRIHKWPSVNLPGAPGQMHGSAEGSPGAGWDRSTPAPLPKPRCGPAFGIRRPGHPAPAGLGAQNLPPRQTAPYGAGGTHAQMQAWKRQGPKG